MKKQIFTAAEKMVMEVNLKMAVRQLAKEAEFDGCISMSDIEAHIANVTLPHLAEVVAAALSRRGIVVDYDE